MKFSMHYVLEQIGSIGQLENDSEEVKIRKTLLVAFASIMTPIGLLWAMVYLLFSEPLAALIPIGYALVSIDSLLVFRRTKSFAFFKNSQLAFSLILPFLLMIALGGISKSSAVILWSLSCPLGALVFTTRPTAIKWFMAYALLVLSSIYLEGLLPASNNLSTTAITCFFVMNILGVSSAVFVLVYFFVGEKDFILQMLKKHKKHEVQIGNL